MTLLLRLDARTGWYPACGLLALVACQEPGADWVEDAATTDSSTASNTVTSSLTTSDGTGADTVSSTDVNSSTSETSTGTGGTTGTTDGEGATNSSTTSSSGDATNDATATTAGGSTSDTTNTTGSGGTGGGGNSLIANGDFSDGETGWESSGDGTVDVSSGEYCVTFNSAGTIFVDWPAGIESTTVQGGSSYVFSYRLYYSGSAASVSVKIGQPVDPYNAYAEGSAAVSTSPQTFMQTFSMDSDDQVGIRFTIDADGGTRVCIDDVRLVAQ